MARKKESTPKKSAYKHEAYIEGSGSIVNESISDTLKKNYMPYAMSVIISRALPEIPLKSSTVFGSSQQPKEISSTRRM